MITVVKLVNVHFTFRQRKTKWAFYTSYDNITNEKKYTISTEKRFIEVDKELGNKLYTYIRKHHPESKAIVIMDNGDEKLRWYRVADHFEISFAGKFVESCESMSEVQEALQRWKGTLHVS